MSSEDLGRVIQMVNGYRHTTLLMAATQSGLIDRLDAGPSDAETLSAELQLDRDALERFLRALKGAGLVNQAGLSYTLTPAGAFLTQSGFGGGLRAWADLVGGEYYQAWGGFTESLRTGRAAFPEAFGMTAWEHRRMNPEMNAAFQRMATGEQRRTLSKLLRMYEFPEGCCVVDVGGGEGSLVRGIRKRYQIRGVLFDLPQVIGEVESGEIELEAGSFLEKVPSGGDVHLLKHVLHNWTDDECITILRNCEEALNQDGRVLILEHLLCEDDPELAMMDLHMMLVLGGRERTQEQYEKLLSCAGLKLVGITELGKGLPAVLDARRAS